MSERRLTKVATCWAVILSPRFLYFSNRWQQWCFNRCTAVLPCRCCTWRLMAVNRVVFLEMWVRSVKVTVVHPVLGCVFSYSPRNTVGRHSAIDYLASNSEFTISWCLQVTHTPSDYPILSHGFCRKIRSFGIATGKPWLLTLFIQWIKDDRKALFAFVSIVTGLISNYCWCQTAVCRVWTQLLR